jgi:hypothetical protein
MVNGGCAPLMLSVNRPTRGAQMTIHHSSFTIYFLLFAARFGQMLRCPFADLHSFFAPNQDT